MTVETLKVQDLSEDCRLNIQEFLIGKSSDLRLKHKKKFVELQRLFKIIYTHHPIKGWSGNIYSCYRIEGKMLNLNILLKQGERLGKAWEDTYERLIENEDLKSRPSYYSLCTDLVVWVKTEKGLIDEEVVINDGDDFDVDKFLQDTKSKISNEMKSLNAIRVISFRFYVHIRY